MSRTATKARLPLRLLAGTFGALLFCYLIYRAGPAQLLESMSTLGWGAGLVIACGGVSLVVKTWAWRLTLLDDKHRVSFGRMLGLRLSSEAVSHLGGLGQLCGDGLRASLLGPRMPLASGIASVTIDRSFFILSSAVVSIIGLLAVLIVLPLPHALALYAASSAFILLIIVLLTAVAVKKRWPVLSGIAQALGRIRYFRRWIERKHPVIRTVENRLLDYYHHTPSSFCASFALNLVVQAAALFEVYLILWLMGTTVSFFGALAIEALTKLVNIAGTFNPGNIGTYEGGNILIVKIFHLGGAAGLTLAFTRRLRSLFWAAVGALCLVVLTKSRKQSDSILSSEDIMRVGSERTSPMEAQIKTELPGHSHIAVILANNLNSFGFGSPMPEVGALPILLRGILGAHQAGAARIVVVIDRAKSPQIRNDLLRTKRLPDNLEWCEFSPGEETIPSLLGRLASETKGHLVLTAGDRVYQPSLHRRAGGWHGEGNALALMTGAELVGIYSLSREVSIDLAGRCPSSASSMEELHASLSTTYSVACEEVTENKWQRILSEKQRQLAERKLDRWLVKPTDGIFARTNRKVSIPISRQIIPLPITPNMVSLFTLGVSFAAGAFFALGGYWYMLTGAILSWLASVLDGCDGEVARLKLQESAFGCWLETVCDYLYYLFIFAGMTIGLARTSGNRAYLVWGGFLLFGVVLSVLITGLQRRQLTNGRPEQYLGVWQKEADSRRSNPFLFLARHTEFIIRRCFLPYALLFFALFNVINWAFIMAAAGANVVWVIALYSYLTFAPSRASTMPSPA